MTHRRSHIRRAIFLNNHTISCIQQSYETLKSVSNSSKNALAAQLKILQKRFYGERYFVTGSRPYENGDFWKAITRAGPQFINWQAFVSVLFPSHAAKLFYNNFRGEGEMCVEYKCYCMYSSWVLLESKRTWPKMEVLYKKVGDCIFLSTCNLRAKTNVLYIRGGKTLLWNTIQVRKHWRAESVWIHFFQIRDYISVKRRRNPDVRRSRLRKRMFKRSERIQKR